MLSGAQSRNLLQLSAWPVLETIVLLFTGQGLGGQVLKVSQTR